MGTCPHVSELSPTPKISHRRQLFSDLPLVTAWGCSEHLELGSHSELSLGETSPVATEGALRD